MNTTELTLQQAMDFLREHRDVALATVANGCPKIRVFQVMKVEGTRLFFATSSHKAVYRELMANPAVEFVGYSADLSVRCAGRADFDVPRETCQWIYDNNAVLSRLYPSADALAYFSVAVEDMDFFDLRPTPPLMRHFDFVRGTESDVPTLPQQPR